MNTHFQNKFGAVRFRPIADVQPVRDIRGANLDPRCMFDIETAEKIALITDNRGIQLCSFKSADGWRCYVVLHATSSTAAVAEIESLTYAGAALSVELQNARREVWL